MTSSITRSAFAKRMGVDRSRVTRWISDGLPLAPDGGVDPVMAEKWLKRHVDPSKRLYAAAERAHAQRQTTPSRGRTQQPPPAPPGTEHLRDNVVDTTMAVVLPMLACRIPAAAVAVAMEHGMPRGDAELLYRAVIVAAMRETTALLDNLSVPAPPQSESWATTSIWNINDFHAANWGDLSVAAPQ